MRSERLHYKAVTPSDLDAFHRLVRDEHVRRYLMDGNVFPREWTEERIHESQGLFERRGVGIWLVYESTTNELVGMCGFLQIPSIHSEPQLVYALLEPFTGRGYATEMARASIECARRNSGFEEIVADVDAVNTASVRVLRKLGFEQVSTSKGAFGDLLLFRLRPQGNP